MDFNIDATGVVTGVIISAVTYVFGGIFKLRIDINHAFKKIRALEKKYDTDTKQADDVATHAAADRAVYLKDDRSRAESTGG